MVGKFLPAEESARQKTLLLFIATMDALMKSDNLPEKREANQNMVRVFHHIFGQACPLVPTHMDAATAMLRKSLVNEEHNEFNDHITAYMAASGDEVARRDLFIDIVDDCIDVIYVCLGTLVSMGVDFGSTFLEVSMSNLSKAGADGKAILREDGKVLKGPNYFKPELGKFIGGIKDHD